MEYHLFLMFCVKVSFDFLFLIFSVAVLSFVFCPWPSNYVTFHSNLGVRWVRRPPASGRRMKKSWWSSSSLQNTTRSGLVHNPSAADYSSFIHQNRTRSGLGLNPSAADYSSFSLRNTTRSGLVHNSSSRLFVVPSSETLQE